MKSKKTLRLFAAAALFAMGSFPARAGADNASTITYDSIDSYRMMHQSGSVTLTVTGVPHGASAPTTVQYYGNSNAPDVVASCERQMIIAVNRPGRFSVTIETNLGTSTLAACTLTRLP